MQCSNAVMRLIYSLLAICRTSALKLFFSWALAVTVTARLRIITQYEMNAFNLIGYN